MSAGEASSGKLSGKLSVTYTQTKCIKYSVLLDVNKHGGRQCAACSSEISYDADTVGLQIGIFLLILIRNLCVFVYTCVLLH